MDVREKLVELLKGSKLCSKRFDDQYSDLTISIIAGHLIANGVMVQKHAYLETVVEVKDNTVCRSRVPNEVS